MTDKEKSQCEKIIHEATAATIMAITFSEEIQYEPLTAIRLQMIVKLGKVFGKEISKHEAGIILQEKIEDVMKLRWIPIVGNAVNVARSMKALGWDIANYFAAVNEQIES